MTITFDTAPTIVDGSGFCYLKTQEVLSTGALDRPTSETFLTLDTSTIAAELEKRLHTQTPITNITVQLGSNATCAASNAPCVRPNALKYSFDTVTLPAVSLAVTGNGTATLPLVWKKMTLTQDGSPKVISTADTGSVYTNTWPTTCETRTETTSTLKTSKTSSTKPFAVVALIDCLDFHVANKPAIAPIAVSINDPRSETIGLTGTLSTFSITTLDAATKTTLSGIDVTGIVTETITGQGPQGSNTTLFITPDQMTHSFSPPNQPTSTFTWSYIDRKS